MRRKRCPAAERDLLDAALQIIHCLPRRMAADAGFVGRGEGGRSRSEKSAIVARAAALGTACTMERGEGGGDSVKEEEGVIVFNDVVRAKCCPLGGWPSNDTRGLSGYRRFEVGRRIGGREVEGVSRIASGLAVFGGEVEK